MRKVLISGLLVALISAVFILMPYAGGEKCGADKNPSQCGSDYSDVMKDAKVEVTNTDGGVVVKITSDDPEKAAGIQKCWSECKPWQDQDKLCASHKGCLKGDAGTLKNGKCPWQKDNQETEAE